MANVTDVFASSVHGTDPQNLIEYITRQRIYDGHFWKQECFGLNAVDVAEKASTNIQCVGGCYGGNRQPTRFLALLLKLLQIQPSEDIVEELIQNEDFGYVRALGAMYLRLTGSPTDIYEQLEPLLLDYRRLRVRTVNGWDLLPMDEYVEQLLRNDRIFDIALPRLPKRAQLEKSGYLDGVPRTSPMNIHFSQEETKSTHEKVTAIHKLLQKMANDGNDNAKMALQTLSWETHEHDSITQQVPNDSNPTQQNNRDKDYRSHDQTTRKDISHQQTYKNNQHHHQDDQNHDNYYDGRRRTRDDSRFHDDQRRRTKNENVDNYNRRGYDTRDNEYSKNNNAEKYDMADQSKSHETILKKESHRDDKVKKKKKRKDKRSYGSLFKNETKKEREENHNQQVEDVKDVKDESHSEDYWNEQRAKLGLKPLRK